MTNEQKRKNAARDAAEQQLRTKLNSGAPCLTGTMQKSLTTFLQEAAEALRDLALRAPDIANELRRFADDLERQAEQPHRNHRTSEDDAAD